MGWQLIKSYTVGDSVTAAPAASVTFNDIPQTYKTLKIAISGRGSRAAIDTNAGIQFNGSTSSFTNRYLEGSGLAAASGQLAKFLGGSSAANATSNTFGNIEVTIPNYSSTTVNKPFSSDAVAETNATQIYSYLTAGLWSNTSAITSITIDCLTSDSFTFGTTFTLYGLA